MVRALAGIIEYSYNDKIIKTPFDYYRPRQVDTDGRAIYSSIKPVPLDEPLSVDRSQKAVL